MLTASPILEILSQIEIKLNWLPMTPFLVHMPGTCLTFGNHLSGNNILVFLINCAKSVKVSIELSEDCYCNLSVSIPNEQTLLRVLNSILFNTMKFQFMDRVVE